MKRNGNDEVGERAVRNQVYAKKAIRQYLLDKIREVLIYSIAGASIAYNLGLYFNS